ncbi:MAG: efflux RND transporter periplasmic adaptor subunit [Pyrinomonadaceae bacterium]
MTKRGFTNVVGAVLAVATLFALSSCGSRGESANANANTQPTVIDVTTTQAVIRQIPTYFEATGNLASDAATDVAPAIGGKVVEVNFDVGSYVTKGSVLLRLDPRDAQIRLQTAEAQVQQQQKALGQAVAALRSAQARLGVRDGETFDIDKFSQVKSVRANLELAEKELVRAERLYNTGDVSKAALDQRRAQRDALLGQLDEARSNAAVAVKAINSAEAQVASAKSAITTAQTQVDQARKSLTDTAVLAPISGYISERTADLGEFISPSVPNAKIATIVRTYVLRLKIDVPEASIGKVATGQSISLQTSAYPDRNFAGTVARILPSLNQQARTLTVEAEVPNPDGLLKPGQFATVRITQSRGENAVMIPASAVKTEGDVNKVYVIKDGAARERLVQLGLLEGETIQVKNGLAENEIVATNNLAELYDGVMVRAL